MNTADLKAYVNAHKGPLGIAGALVVAGLALYARKRSALAKAGSPGGTTSSSTSGATSAGTYSAYGQTVPYDSSATDVYNQLQPQIEALQQMSRNIPVSSAPTAASDLPDGYYQAAGDQAIFKAKNGTLDFLTQPEAVALGYPTPTIVSKDDPMWKAPVLDPGFKIPWVQQ